MGINDEKLKEDFVDFAIGLRRFPALLVKFEFRRDIQVRKHAEFAGYVSSHLSLIVSINHEQCL